MKTTEQICHPGQVLALNLKCGSILMAKDGAIRVEYQDGALDWLLDAAPVTSILLAEGSQYVLQSDAFIKIQTDGTRAVTWMVHTPSRSWVPPFLVRTNLARSSHREASSTGS